MAAIDHGAIAQQLNLEPCEIGHPIGGAAEAVPADWIAAQLDFMLSWEKEKLAPGLL